MRVGELELCSVDARLPSDITSRLVRPKIGARIVRYSRSSCAMRTFDSAAVTFACATSKRDYRFVATALADRVLFEQQQNALVLAASLVETCLRYAASSRCARNRACANRLGIDLEQWLAFFDRGCLLDNDALSRITPTRARTSTSPDPIVRAVCVSSSGTASGDTV